MKKIKYYKTKFNIGISLLLFVSTLGVNVSYTQEVKAVAYTSITVSDLNRSIAFFTDVLSFQKISEKTIEGLELNYLLGINYKNLKLKKAKLKIGNEFIELVEYVQPANGKEIPYDSKSNDLWFQHIAIVTNDMDMAYEQLKKHKVVHVSSSPQTLPDYIPGAAGIKAFYFRDPDGHNLEIIYFPKGKGDPKWQDIKTGPFIGIDHTAIGISDTDQSTQFYSNTIGLSVAGNSENYGSEQEHLNQVFGAHLLITGLRAPIGFGVEFLQYIAPPGGRKYPVNSKTNDLWHWHTTIIVTEIDKLYQKLRERGYLLISDKVANIKTFDLGGNKGFLVRDPDGHAILFIE